MPIIEKRTQSGEYSYINTDEKDGTVVAERDFPGVFPVYYTVTESGCFCDFSIENVLRRSGIARKAID